MTAAARNLRSASQPPPAGVGIVNPAMDRPTFDLYGISAALIADTLGIHPDTARRYKRTGRLPAALAALLALRLAGDLGPLAPAWSGWRLRSSTLWTPEGAAVTPGDIRAIPYRRAQLAHLERLALEPRQWTLDLSGAGDPCDPSP